MYIIITYIIHIIYKKDIHIQITHEKEIYM